MSPLLRDYAERFTLACVASLAFIAGMAGLVALPASALLVAFRKEWPSQTAPSTFPIVTPVLLAIGGGALCYAAYSEYQSRISVQAPANRRNPKALPIAALVILTGPMLVIAPIVYRWFAGILSTLSAGAGGLAGEFSFLLAPIWVGVLLPPACLVALSLALVIAGPAGLILYLGGSQRTSRILSLAWMLQLVLLISSVPALYEARLSGPQAELIGFVCVVLCVVTLGYSVPLFAIRRESWASHTTYEEFPHAPAPADAQAPAFLDEQAAAPSIAPLLIPQNSFVIRRAGGWIRYVSIIPPVFAVSAPAYNIGKPGLIRVSPEGGLPVRGFLLETKEGALCRIRRCMMLFRTTAYVIEDVRSRQILFEVSRVSADGADWVVTDWGQRPLGTLSLHGSSLSGIEFDLLIAGAPCVRYFWRMNVILPEVSGEWQDPVPPGFHSLLAVAVGIMLAHFLPEGLSRTRDWWRHWRWG